MKKVTLLMCCLFLCIINAKNVFAFIYSEYSKNESSTSGGFSNVKNETYFNQLLNLNNIHVKFTQDENRYIFQITADGSINIYADIMKTPYNSGASALVPMLYKKENFGNEMYIQESSKMPFIDFKSGNLFSYSKVKICNEDVAYCTDSYTVKSDGNHSNIVYERNGNGDRYYIPNDLRNDCSKHTYNYRYASQYPIDTDNNGAGVSLISNNSSYSFSHNDVIKNGLNCIDSYYANINVKIAISKSYINDYRYICFAQSYLVSSNHTLTDLTESMRGVSICSQTIDLKEYAECNHNWSITKGDKNSHNLYCENCEWELTESHKLLYEYDGIKNNVCTCSYIDKVKHYFKINDNYTKEVTEILDSNSKYIKHEFKNKTGYKFKHYEIYEKQLIAKSNLSTNSNATKTVFIATSSELPDKTGQTSVIYKACYDPNHFTIKYSNINNKNIEINETIDSQQIEYDEKVLLKKNIHCVGYVFDGWSYTKGSDIIDLKPMQEVTNYTDIDNYELNLFPVYSNLDFKIIYLAGRGHFSDGSKRIEKMYTYYDDAELEKVLLYNKDEYFIEYVDGNGNQYKKMSDIKEYIEKNGINNVTLSLSPKIGRMGIGEAEITDPTIDIVDIKDDEQIISETYDNMGFDNNIQHSSKIFGMSDTNKDETRDEKLDKKTIKAAVIATLSFIADKGINEKVPDSKLAVLKMFIKSHLMLCLIGGLAFVILLILYEFLIISNYKNALKE